MKPFINVMEIFGMQRIRTSLLIVMAALAFHGRTVAQQNPVDMDAVMAAAKPGPQHELLKQFTGRWNQKIEFSMMPETPSVEGTGNVTNEMILGGRFLQSKGLIDAMGIKGNALQIIGYDNRRETFFMFSIDEMGTYAVNAEGTYDAALKTFTFHGAEDDGTMKMDFRILMRIVSPTEYISEIYFMLPNGEEHKAMQITSTREA